jgi:hypothetical protein
MSEPTGTVQRGDVGVCYCAQGIHIDRVKNADGDYVTYDDHKAAIDALAAQAVALAEGLEKVKNWLLRLIAHDEQQIKTCRFESLNEAFRADIKNYRATVADIDKRLKQAQALLDAQGRKG